MLHTVIEESKDYNEKLKKVMNTGQKNVKYFLNILKIKIIILFS